MGKHHLFDFMFLIETVPIDQQRLQMIQSSVFTVVLINFVLSHVINLN